jgi:hypothetical protein
MPDVLSVIPRFSNGSEARYCYVAFVQTLPKIRKNRIHLDHAINEKREEVGLFYTLLIVSHTSFQVFRVPSRSL